MEVRDVDSSEVLINDLLELIVQHKHKGASSATQHVGQGALEEGLGALLAGDLAPGIECTLVMPVLATSLHRKHGLFGNCIQQSDP